ncbi:uncharacterized protein LOC119096490 [Pollicipes pollicipes]|nr:uncharacterized protein LOC119096490 [Pollicipes pollicipes]
MLSATVLAAALGAAAASELDTTSMEDVLDPRLFIIYNSTNSNALNYVLAGVAVALLFGLLLALALFAFGFFGSSANNRYDYYEPDTYATYSNQGFQSRSLGPAYDAINVL